MPTRDGERSEHVCSRREKALANYLLYNESRGEYWPGLVAKKRSAQQQGRGRVAEEKILWPTEAGPKIIEIERAGVKWTGS